MGKDEGLPRTEEVLRYVGGSNFDPDTGKVHGGAFDRTAKDADGLSFTRVGVFSQDLTEDDANVRAVNGARLSLGKTAVFAQVNVGATIDALTPFESDFYFCADPLKERDGIVANPAHALLGFVDKGYPEFD